MKKKIFAKDIVEVVKKAASAESSKGMASCLDATISKIRAEATSLKPTTLDSTKRVGRKCEGPINFHKVKDGLSFDFSKQVYHLDELINFDREEFVEYAYLTVLKRNPDAGGFSHYLQNLLRKKITKESILLRLRYSKEGRAKGITIRFLMRGFCLSILYNIPIVGYLLKLIATIINLPKLSKAVTTAQKYTTELNKQQQYHLNILSSQVDDFFQNNAVDVESILAELTLKADSVSVERLIDGLNQKADKRFVKSIREGVESKADSKYVEQLSEIIKLKAEIRVVDSLRSEMIDKASLCDLNALEEALAKKVNNEYVEQLSENLKLKADTESVELLRAETKDKASLDDVRNLERIVAKKADLTVIKDSDYAEFEMAFRGSEEEVTSRLKVYLDVIPKLNGPKCGRALDLGCGRGEWLRLMATESYEALGIDVNTDMVAHCLESGLPAVQSDALSYLEGESEDSLQLITAFHLIEHIPFETMFNIFKQCFRVLTHDGVMILETPNLKNILVGAGDFYLDPTHMRPLHPLTMQFFLKKAGFSVVEIYYVDRKLISHEKTEFNELNDYVNIPRDYSLICKKK
ncbi:hypothetical protein BM527_16530 [Alteromonas sp. Mex14]|nr:hypothetical protein BM527_16530 [Alteromonas sp. Mex14]